MPVTRPVKQRGASLIAAVFAVVGLSVLGLIAVQLSVVTSQEQIRSWNAEQALYAAESGVDWAANRINQGGSCAVNTGNTPLATGTGIDAWFDVASAAVSVDGRTVCSINATGKAGGTAASPHVQRQINVLYAPAVVR